MLTELKALKTLACQTCGELWSDTSEECLVADDNKHQFIELADHLDAGVKDTLVCKICGQERGYDVNCHISYNQQHQFVVVQLSY